jgi:hypothetical protein
LTNHDLQHIVFSDKNHDLVPKSFRKPQTWRTLKMKLKKRKTKACRTSIQAKIFELLVLFNRQTESIPKTRTWYRAYEESCAANILSHGRSVLGPLASEIREIYVSQPVCDRESEESKKRFSVWACLAGNLLRASGRQSPYEERVPYTFHDMRVYADALEACANRQPAPTQITEPSYGGPFNA